MIDISAPKEDIYMDYLRVCQELKETKECLSQLIETPANERHGSLLAQTLWAIVIIMAIGFGVAFYFHSTRMDHIEARIRDVWKAREYCQGI